MILAFTGKEAEVKAMKSTAIGLRLGKVNQTEPEDQRRTAVPLERAGNNQGALPSWTRVLSTAIATVDSSAPTIARVALGLVMFPHGAQKVLGWFGGHGYSGTMQFFTGSMHIPAFFAFLAIAAEFAGSIALLTGLLGRLAALGIGTNMLVAILTVHASNGFFMNWTGAQKGEGFEYHLLALALALIVIVYGSGKASLDALLARRLRRQ